MLPAASAREVSACHAVRPLQRAQAERLPVCRRALRGAENGPPGDTVPEAKAAAQQEARWRGRQRGLMRITDGMWRWGRWARLAGGPRVRVGRSDTQKHVARIVYSQSTGFDVVR
eukprot:6852166-Prymnesium_polylepis.1